MYFGLVTGIMGAHIKAGPPGEARPHASPGEPGTWGSGVGTGTSGEYSKVNLCTQP